MSQEPLLPNLIIAGTLKAATSSVFGYLSSHPAVCGSSVKETLFFLKDYTGDRNEDIKFYSKYLDRCSPDAAVAVEATPGYLEGAEVAARRIRQLLPAVRLLFILRNPIDRFYSYYNFHRGQLTPGFGGLSLRAYMEKCISYSSNKAAPNELGLAAEHPRALEVGRYAEYLKEYYEVFPREQITVMFYEHLKSDVSGFMAGLCDILGIDAEFYKDYAFNKVNVTAYARIKYLHKVALSVNRRLEGFLRQRPAIKGKIVSVYKFLNQKQEGYPDMDEADRRMLEDYYAPSNRELADLLTDCETAEWVR